MILWMVRMSVPAAACKVANVLRYEWNVMFLVIPVFSASSNPLFHGVLRPASFQSFEYQPCLFGRITNQLQGFVTNGDDIFCLCLLSDGMDAFPSGCKVNDFFPPQCENIADSQTCQAREQRGGFQNRYLARRFCQSVQFFYAEIVFDDIFRLYFLQEIVYIG